MPLNPIPPLQHEWNFIKKVMTHPCATPSPLAVIETGFTALGVTMAEVFGFSCLDIVKARAGISWKCGRVIKAAMKNSVSPFAFDSVHGLYKFVAPLEAALWYFFLSQEVLKGINLWTSLMYERSGCDALGATSGQWLCAPVLCAPGPRQPIICAVPQNPPAIGPTGDTLAVNPGYHANVTAWGNWRKLTPSDPGGGSFRVSMENVDTGAVVFDHKESISGLPNGDTIIGAGTAIGDNPNAASSFQLYGHGDAWMVANTLEIYYTSSKSTIIPKYGTCNPAETHTI